MTHKVFGTICSGSPLSRAFRTVQLLMSARLSCYRIFRWFSLINKKDMNFRLTLPFCNLPLQTEWEIYFENEPFSCKKYCIVSSMQLFCIPILLMKDWWKNWFMTSQRVQTMMHFKYLGFILKYLEILIDPVFRKELVEKNRNFESQNETKTSFTRFYYFCLVITLTVKSFLLSDCALPNRQFRNM